MSKVMTMEEVFKLKRNIEAYSEKWEDARTRDDPLIKKWEKHIEKKTEKTRA